MAGQLKTNPLPELIREISAGGLSGALRLARERAKTVVYFDAGEIIYAASNIRAFRLAESARRWKVLTEAQLAGLQEKTSDLDFGEALVKAGTLSREMLDALMTRQVSELLYQTLRWTTGDWDYNPRVRLADEIRVSVKTKRLLLESARHLPAEFASASFADQDERIYLETDALNDLNLLPTEVFVLTRVGAGLSIKELLAISGLPEAEALPVIYTLALGGFLRRDKWPQALSEEETAKGRVAATPPAKPKSLGATPGKIESKTAVKAVEPEAPRNEQEEIEALFARLNSATDHYQQLGVRRSAGASDIKRAYYALAKRFHPDRFRREVDAERLASIESAFAQIAQAYDTLKDTNARAVYDSKLLKQEQEMRGAGTAKTVNNQGVQNLSQEEPKTSRSEPTSAASSQPPTYQVEEIFQQGLSALQKGNSAVAIASLGEAARLAPNESRYRAYYGQALARDERLRRNAEAELKAAIALDASNASYRVMLAELYSQIGLLKRAQGELDRALAADPNNEAARELHDKLKRG
jgi:curved DNA-binding protein CbpA